MLRLFNALNEWWQLRARLREERRFHLDCAEADLRGSGLTARQSRRDARRRYGRQSLNLAASELGCDLPGLSHLLRAHRVPASAWLQPVALFTICVTIFLLSPRPLELAGGVFVRAHRQENRGATILNLDDGSGWYVGAITGREFSALQSMTTLTRLERYRGSYAWGQAASGATLSAIEAEARRVTGNSRIVAEAVGPKWELLANPAQSAWLVIAGYGAFLLVRYRSQFASSRSRLWRWLLYGIGVAMLHAAASLAVWGFLLQRWNLTRVTTSAAIVLLACVFMAWLGAVAMQCRYWWIDLRCRCPLCFERMVLPLTEGAAESMIVRPAVTESVCAHGHGVLVDSRWSRTFRPEESPIESLANFHNETRGLSS